MTAWTAESLPPGLVAMHDQPGGTSLIGLAGILNAYDALRAEPDPAAVYGGDLTAPLCCCKRGMECAECFTGHHWTCPDRDDDDYDAPLDDDEQDDDD